MDAVIAFGACLFIAYIIVDYHKNRDKLKKLEKQVETLKNEIQEIKQQQ